MPSFEQAARNRSAGYKSKNAFTFATIEENGEVRIGENALANTPPALTHTASPYLSRLQIDYGSSSQHDDPYATPSLISRVESNGNLREAEKK